MRDPSRQPGFTLFFKSLFKSILGKQEVAQPQVRSEAMLIGPAGTGDVRTQVRMLMIEKEVIQNALTLVDRAKEKGILSEDEQQSLNARYQKDLSLIGTELSDKKRLLELQELEVTKRSLQDSYLRRLVQIEERIRELSSSILGEPKPGFKPLPAETHQPSMPSRVTDKHIEDLKNEIKRAMEKLEQIEDET